MDISFIGPSAASVIVVIYFLKYIGGKDKADEERDKLFAESLMALTESTKETNKEVVKEARLSRKVQERGFNEAKERNGHLGDIARENQESNNANQVKILELMNNITEQNVTTQTVTN